MAQQLFVTLLLEHQQQMMLYVMVLIMTAMEQLMKIMLKQLQAVVLDSALLMEHCNA